MIFLRAQQLDRALREPRRRPMTDSEYRVMRAKHGPTNDLSTAEGIAAACMLSIGLLLIAWLVLRP